MHKYRHFERSARPLGERTKREINLQVGSAEARNECIDGISPPDNAVVSVPLMKGTDLPADFSLRSLPKGTLTPLEMTAFMYRKAEVEGAELVSTPLLLLFSFQ